MNQPAKDGRETLQERATKTATDIVSGWIDGGDMTLSPAQRVALVTGITAALMTSERNALDAAQAEIAKPKDTNLKLGNALADCEAFAEANAETPLPVAEDVVAKAADILAQRQYERERRSVGVQEATPEQLANTPTQVWGAYYNNAYEDVQAIASLLRQPKVAPEGVIRLTPAEIQSGHDRVKWAEGLIRQLPEDHDGRNSWLLNYASAPTPASAVASEAGEAPKSHVDHQQRRGAFADMIEEALESYHAFYMDDDFDYKNALDKICERLKERYEGIKLSPASTPAPASAQDELVKALEEANKRIAKLERLLRPFAAEAHLWGENVPDRYRPLVTEPKQRIPSGGARTAFNIGNCRRAAAALSAGAK